MQEGNKRPLGMLLTRCSRLMRPGAALTRGVLARRTFIYKDKDTTIMAPQFKSGRGLVGNSLEYVRQVDATRKQIDAIPTRAKTHVLLERLEGHAELLYYLALFHRQLAAVGITQGQLAAQRAQARWRYRVRYFVLLRHIHGILFEHCRVLGITEHLHRLGFSPREIGILDPDHFLAEEYAELQLGVYRGTSYRDMVLIGDNPFK